MGRCVCLSWLFRKRGYNQVRGQSVSADLGAELPQAMHDSPKKHTSEAHLDSPPPAVRSDIRKESGTYVFRQDTVHLVPSGCNVGKSQEAPVVVSEDKISTVRKRLASM